MQTMISGSRVPGWRITAMGTCVGTVCHVTPLVPSRQKRFFEPAPATPTCRLLAEWLFNWATRSPCRKPSDIVTLQWIYKMLVCGNCLGITYVGDECRQYVFSWHTRHCYDKKLYTGQYLHCKFYIRCKAITKSSLGSFECKMVSGKWPPTRRPSSKLDLLSLPVGCFRPNIRPLLCIIQHESVDGWVHLDSAVSVQPTPKSQWFFCENTGIVCSTGSFLVPLALQSGALTIVASICCLGIMHWKLNVNGAYSHDTLVVVIEKYLVYWVPATGTWSPQIAYLQSL